MLAALDLARLQIAIALPCLTALLQCRTRGSQQSEDTSEPCCIESNLYCSVLSGRWWPLAAQDYLEKHYGDSGGADGPLRGDPLFIMLRRCAPGFKPAVTTLSMTASICDHYGWHIEALVV